jgi:hypothetical protein
MVLPAPLQVESVTSPAIQDRPTGDQLDDSSFVLPEMPDNPSVSHLSQIRFSVDFVPFGCAPANTQAFARPLISHLHASMTTGTKKIQRLRDMGLR